MSRRGLDKSLRHQNSKEKTRIMQSSSSRSSSPHRTQQQQQRLSHSLSKADDEYKRALRSAMDEHFYLTSLRPERPMLQNGVLSEEVTAVELREHKRRGR